MGAHALAIHGYPRNPYDLDLWVRRSAEAAQRIRAALNEFGVEIGQEGERQFVAERSMFLLGVPPNQIDILTFLDGCDFDQAWQRRVMGDLAGHRVGYLSLEDYVQTKRSSGREKDMRDLGELRKVLGSLPGED